IVVNVGKAIIRCRIHHIRHNRIRTNEATQGRVVVAGDHVNEAEVVVVLVAGVAAVRYLVGGRHAPAAKRIVPRAVLQVPLVVADNGHAAQVVPVDVEQAVVGAVRVVNDTSGHGRAVQ